MQNTQFAAADPIGWHGTTILCVRRDGHVAMAGDGQVSLGQTVVKGNARKVRANITLQVVPFRSGGHAAEAGAFTIMRFPEVDLPDVVYLEHLTSALYLDKREDVEKYTEVMERLSVEGESPERTIDILSGMLEEVIDE